MNSPALSSNANCTRAHASRACGMWRDYAKNAVESRPMRQKKFGKDPFGLRPLQPPEITQNRQSFLWKSLEENRRGLEKLGEKAWARLYFDIFAPADWRAIRLHINILKLVFFLAEAAKVRALTKCGCARRARCCCAGREEGPTAKRSRPEMAPQRLEKIESAPGNGMGSEASNPQDVVHGRAADRARLRPTKSCRKRRLTLWNR